MKIFLVGVFIVLLLLVPTAKAQSTSGLLDTATKTINILATTTTFYIQQGIIKVQIFWYRNIALNTSASEALQRALDESTALHKMNLDRINQGKCKETACYTVNNLCEAFQSECSMVEGDIRRHFSRI